jgi:hypothetical protein
LDQESLSLLCQLLYPMLCQQFFAHEFRRTFQHSFGTQQRALDRFLEAYNRERVVCDAPKPRRTPLGVFLEGIGPVKQGESGSEGTLSTPNRCSSSKIHEEL